MSDTSLSQYIQYGTSSARGSYTPSPPSGIQTLYLWYETDNPGVMYAWNGSAWVQVTGSGSGGGANFTGAGHPQGSQTATAGQTYLDTSAGALYRKLAGSGNTGWYRDLAMGGLYGMGPSPIYTSLEAGLGAAASGTTNYMENGFVVANFSGTTNTLIFITGQGPWVRLTTTASASGNAGNYQNAFTLAYLDWSQDFDAIWRIRTDASSIADTRLWFGLGTADPTNSDTYGGNGVFIRYSSVADASNWHWLTDDGTTQNAGAISAIAANTEYILRIRQLGSSVFFSVGDGAETERTTALPATGTPYWLQMATNIAGSGGTRSIECKRFTLLYGS